MVPGDVTGKSHHQNDKIGVCKKKNGSWVFSGEKKIPTLRSTLSRGKLGEPCFPLERVDPRLGFSYVHWTPMMDSIYLPLLVNLLRGLHRRSMTGPCFFLSLSLSLSCIFTHLKALAKHSCYFTYPRIRDNNIDKAKNALS